MDKSKTREIKKKQRLALSSQVVKSASGLVFRKLLESGLLKNAQNVCLYLPKVGANEIDTFPIVKYLLSNKIKCFAPVVSSNFELREIVDVTKLELNSWNIPEPVGTKTINPSRIDVFIIPAIAFDLDGYRIGYGSGYYDKLLENCQDNVKISLAYEISKIDEDQKVDFEPSDVRMDYVITESRVYSRE